jgi:hypothetical protein
MHIVNVNSITKGQTSDDGGTVYMRFGQAEGGEIEIACPASMVQPLVLLASHLMAQANEKSGNKDKFDYVAAQSWGMNHFPDGRLLLTLGMAGGGKVSFALPPQSFQQLVEIVDRLKARATEVPEGASIN